MSVKEVKKYEEIGAKHFTAVLINYLLWIIENAKKDKVDIICFLARDGYIIKKCYDLYSDIIDNNIPKSKYLYASRSIFYNAAITSKYDWVDNLLCDLPLGQTIESYFIRWDIQEQIYMQLLKQNNMQKSYIISSEDDKKIVKRLYYEVRGIIEQKSKENREILRQYWEEEGLFGKKVAFVDIGWNGSCQSCIEKIVQIEKFDIDMKFYFLGTLDTNKTLKLSCNNYKGYIFNFGEPRELVSKIYEGIPIIDTFFSAPHSYIVGLRKENEKIIPVYDKLELLENITYVNYMQQGVIKEINNIFKNYKLLERVKKQNIIPLINLIENPTKTEAKAISKFEVSVTYGTERYNIPIIERVSVLSFVNNKELVLKRYKETMWKRGYTKINNCIVKFLLKRGML